VKEKVCLCLRCCLLGCDYHVTWEINTDISKESFASIFYPEDGSSVIWVLIYQTIWHHIQYDSIFIVSAMRTPMLHSVWVIIITVAYATRVRKSQVINSIVSSSHLLQNVCHCYAWHYYSPVLQGWKYGIQVCWLRQLRFEHPLRVNCPSKCWVRPSWTVSAKGRGASSSWHCCILLCVRNIGSYSMFRDCL